MFVLCAVLMWACLFCVVPSVVAATTVRLTGVEFPSGHRCVMVSSSVSCPALPATGVLVTLTGSGFGTNPAAITHPAMCDPGEPLTVYGGALLTCTAQPARVRRG